jgi:hypothetical protein
MTETLDPLGGPLRHLPRACPPWAAQGRTVCGRSYNDVQVVLPWDEAQALVRKIGRRRAEFLFCQTCLSMHGSRMASPARWEQYPDQVVQDYAQRSSWRSTADGEQTRAELRGLALLVAAHREEFEGYVYGLLNDALANRRQQQRRRR